MSNVPHRPSVPEIIASMRFWLVFAWTVTARVLLDTIDARSLRWHYILPVSFLMALWMVWSWDFFNRKKR